MKDVNVEKCVGSVCVALAVAAVAYFTGSPGASVGLGMIGFIAIWV